MQSKNNLHGIPQNSYYMLGQILFYKSTCSRCERTLGEICINQYTYVVFRTGRQRHKTSHNVKQQETNLPQPPDIDSKVNI